MIVVFTGSTAMLAEASDAAAIAGDVIARLGVVLHTGSCMAVEDGESL